MTKNDSAKVESSLQERTLQREEIHSTWLESYRTTANEAFYDEAFDFIASQLPQSQNIKILDAGCGSGHHTVRIAARGFNVHAIDFSPHVLEIAQATIHAHGLSGRVNLERQTLNQLQIPSDSVDAIIVWGVLMHIPDIKSAISEIARVLKPGGKIFVSEINEKAPEAIFLRWLMNAVARKRWRFLKKSEGIECWTQTSDGPVMTRHANISWLINEFQQQRIKLLERRAGQFSELYTHPIFKQFLAWLVHIVNRVWFKFIRWPHPALGNILVFEKSPSAQKFTD